MAKVLISFVGASAYKECVYHTESEKSGVVQFVQEALAKIVCKDWTEKDKIFIFLTDDAKIKNWEGNLYNGIGLKQRLNNLNLNCQIIPKGNFQEGIGEIQIWKNFEMIYDVLEKEDKVWIDITNAFRSIPIFATILVHYAKFLKNINVEGVYYGAFEALKVPAFKIDELIPDPQDRSVPIINLTSLIKLQEWTVAANDFVNYGNAKALYKLAVENNQTNIGNYIKNIAKNISSVRTIEIQNGEKIDDVKSIIEVDGDIPKPLNHLVEVVEKKIKKFTTGNVLNGFYAVEWCIAHGLIQQGITLLYEFLQTYILVDINEDWTSKELRNLTTWALNKKKIEPILVEIDTKDDLSDDKKEQEKKIISNIFELPYKKELTTKVYIAFSQGARNDINHAGIRDNPKTAQQLEHDLNKYTERTKNILNIN